MKEFSLIKKFNWELAHQPIKDQVLPIIIPTPTIKIVGTEFGVGNPTLLASYLPYSDSVSETFKKYNPKFYLFRYKSAQKSTVNGTVKIRPKGFVHPTHLEGINFPSGPIYRGAGRIPMHTEFDLGNINPYEYTTLGFVPYEFVQVGGHDNWRPMTSADWGQDTAYYRFTGKKNKNTGNIAPPTTTAKSTLFKIAIGIENPTGSKTNPILFGDFSDTFRLQLVVNGTPGEPLTQVVQKFSMQLQLSSVKRHN